MLKELHIFDMDGVLIDSREATLQAYFKAAQQIGYPFSVDLWGRSAAEWQCPEELHILKSRFYEEQANSIMPAWAAPLFLSLPEEQVRIWTGASLQSVQILRGVPHLRVLLQRPIRAGMTLRDKRYAMLGIRATWPLARLHYYDDNLLQANTIVKDILNLTVHFHSEGEHTTCLPVYSSPQLG